MLNKLNVGHYAFIHHRGKAWLVLSDNFLKKSQDTYGGCYSIFGQIIHPSWGSSIESLNLGTGPYRALPVDSHINNDRCSFLLDSVIQGFEDDESLQLNDGITVMIQSDS